MIFEFNEEQKRKEERQPLEKAWQRKRDIEEAFQELCQERFHQSYIPDYARISDPQVREKLMAEAEKIVDSMNE